MNKQQFIQELEKDNITISQEQILLLDQYYEHLIEWNKKMNLTSIIDKEEVYLKHFYDSITLVINADLRQGSTICDIGAGAGFPSIPVKIVRPDLKITIVDSLNKRITFVNYVIKELGLTDIEAKHDRAESHAERYREHYDYVTARAVARLSILSELCIPLVREGGHFIAMKGQTGEEELKEATTAYKTLGTNIKSSHIFELPFQGGTRTIIIFKKIKKTPKKYPRNYGKIKKKPL
ncbi:16S rRNA (guanine(527)-N(7))-methyltransferase RsmG [Haloplasma contractile]|uniref:Ribosomal RNA small subunit methyltransferase G n=1 Tax=Haloplasma contractile SSD-17B TaxID=1033810 RepID=F7PT39_9MOLU|nr:16S rRNA (guanine(527)-N(7))-methyltransferase RsmG [Haloplasma contractile]ERJ12549.1 Ribosomal RNA small subunit methyltransferase G protein [Haloplasma contractile SSD-17B]